MESSRRRFTILSAYVAVIFAVNAYVCKNLFALEFSQRMESIEGSYMSIARWAAANWSDLTWFPLWFNGMPFAESVSAGIPFHCRGIVDAARLDSAARVSLSYCRSLTVRVR